MSPLAQRVAATVYRNSPHAICFTCLAAQHELAEHDVRAAALVLIARLGIGLVRRTCYSCRRVDEVLIAETAA
jgi:hypothetical protein